MVLGNLFRKNPFKNAAADLYDLVVKQARQPAFYLKADVPDTVDGRFEMVALHAFLVMRRLKREGDRGQTLSQSLFDRMFADMDHSIRELGVGDLSVGKRIKAMAQVFYGRVVAYEEALDEGDVEKLKEALARNHYGTLESSPSDKVLTEVARYIIENDKQLAEQTFIDLSNGKVRFCEFAG